MNIIIKFIKEKITKYIYLSMLLLLFLFKPEFKTPIDSAKLTIYIIFFFIAITIHLLSQKDKNWFRLDVLFLLGFGIVHYQWAIMYSISNIDLRYLTYVRYGFVNLDYMNYGTWLSTVGILAWFLGYSFFPTKQKKIVHYKIKYIKLFWISLISFSFFLVFAGSNFLSGAIYKGEGGSANGVGISVYFQLLFGISILALTAVVILDSKDKYQANIITWFTNLDKKYLLLAGAYVLLFLSIGDRGAGLQVTLAFLVLYGTLVKSISFKQFMLIITVGAIILTLIGLGRSSDSNENILLAGAKKATFKSNYDATMELANSSRTLYNSLANVPKEHDYFLGKLWLSKFLSVIPLFQKVYLELTGDKAYELGSASYITYLRFGLHPPSGEGTSLVADIYLNFGLIGVIFFMLLLGLFMKKLQNELNIQTNFYWIVAATLFASYVFYMGRSNLFVSLRPMLWGVFLSMLFVKYKKVVK